MNLHLNKELFRDLIDTINIRTGIAIDIIEKDYNEDGEIIYTENF